MRQAVRLDRLARRFLGCLGADRASRLCLSLFFKAVLGIQRIFHFSTLQDPGLAILTGGRKVLSREQLGSWLRQVPTRAVQALLRDSEPTVPRHPEHTLSVDEHCVPRFTRKFRIKKGYHTIRNKFMPVEKLFFSFHLGMRSLLSLIVTRGNGKLCLLAHKLRDRLRLPRARCHRIPAARRRRGQEIPTPCCGSSRFPTRSPSCVLRVAPLIDASGKSCPPRPQARLEEPGPYSAAPPKVIHVAQTVTQLHDTRQQPGRSYPVRTIIVREAARRGKERWHALWVFGDDTTPLQAGGTLPAAPTPRAAVSNLASRRLRRHRPLGYNQAQPQSHQARLPAKRPAVVRLALRPVHRRLGAPGPSSGQPLPACPTRGLCVATGSASRRSCTCWAPTACWSCCASNACARCGRR